MIRHRIGGVAAAALSVATFSGATASAPTELDAVPARFQSHLDRGDDGASGFGFDDGTARDDVERIVELLDRLSQNRELSPETRNLLTVVAQHIDSQIDVGARGEQRFRVEVTNVSRATNTKVETEQGPKPISLSPGAFGVYSSRINPAFIVGVEASAPLGGEGLENIAEDGRPMQLAEAFQQTPAVSDSGTFAAPEGQKQGLEPGESVSFTVTASPGERLTLATMFGPSNDAFYGPSNGIPLFDRNGEPISGDVTRALGTYDAGTEENQEFFGPATKPMQPRPDFGPTEDSVVLPVSEVEGQPQVYPDVRDVIRVTVMPLSDR
jgi:hypothetical protein